ncbi:MerR family transcriptional regulator [Actinacidiphila yeochonensis]|uniref:MerR family transcriptional regulator n=1 Tax=Actinacidiphila yeochonensis TaxID=89050 RepID=UPI000560541F|nr:MerR family transcriptional regulator [Actinacidiphila yeochonensis]
MTVVRVAKSSDTGEVRGGRAGPRATAGCAGHPRPDGQDWYTISEVSDATGLSAHTLRWYERIGLLPRVDRSHTGQRQFSKRDLDWLGLVGKLRLTGMPVADMVAYAELVRAGSHTFGERRTLLETTRTDVLRRIAELQDTLTVLDGKIAAYAGAAAAAPERNA